jgi:hypothetical protein
MTVYRVLLPSSGLCNVEVDPDSDRVTAVRLLGAETVLPVRPGSYLWGEAVSLLDADPPTCIPIA